MELPNKFIEKRMENRKKIASVTHTHIFFNKQPTIINFILFKFSYIYIYFKHIQNKHTHTLHSIFFFTFNYFETKI